MTVALAVAAGLYRDLEFYRRHVRQLVHDRKDLHVEKTTYSLCSRSASSVTLGRVGN